MVGGEGAVGHLLSSTYLPLGFCWRVCIEGRLTYQHLIQYDPHTPPITTRGVTLKWQIQIHIIFSRNKQQYGKRIIKKIQALLRNTIVWVSVKRVLSIDDRTNLLGEGPQGRCSWGSPPGNEPGTGGVRAGDVAPAVWVFRYSDIPLDSHSWHP